MPLRVDELLTCPRHSHHSALLPCDLSESILAHMREAVYSISPDQRTGYYFSPSFETLLGCSPHLLLSDPTRRHAAIPEADRLVVTACWQNLLKCGEMEVEYRAELPHGTVWLHERATLVPGSGGRSVRVDGLVRNVTRRRRIQEQRDKNARRLLNVVENLPVGAVYLHGRRIVMNLALRTMLQVGRTEVRSVEEWIERFLPHNSIGSADQWLTSLSENGPIVWDLLCGDGIRRKVECLRSRFAPDEEVWVLRDITQNEREHRLLSDICRSLRIGAWEFDRLTRKLHWSDTMYDIHGLDPETCTPEAELAVSYYAPEDAEKAREAVHNGAVNAQGWDIELNLVLPNAQRKTVRAIGRAEAPDPEPTRLWGAFQEIDEQVRVRTELEDALHNARIYEQMFELTNALVLVTDADGAITKINGAWETALGIPTDTLLQQGITSLLHPDDLPTYLQTMAPLAAGTSATARTEVRLRNSSGRCQWFALCATADTSRNRIYTIGIDITEQRNAKSLDQVRNRILDELVAEHHSTDILRQVCSGLAAIIPGSRTSILVLHDAALRHAASVNLPQAYIDATDGIVPAVGVGSCGHSFATGQDTLVEDVLVHPNWQQFRYLAEIIQCRACWSVPVVDDNNVVLGTLAVYRDVPSLPTPFELHALHECARLASLAFTTQRSRDARTAAEIRYRTLFDNCPDAIWQVSEQGIIEDVNAVAVQRYGIPHQQFIGRHVSSFAPPHLQGIVGSRIRQVMETGARFEWEHITDAGEHIPVEINSNPIVVNGRKCCVSVIRDIREQKSQMAEVQAARELLERTQAAAQVGSWEYDLRTQKVVWSEETYRLLQWPREKDVPTYSQLLSLRDEKQSAELQRLVETAVQTGEPYVFLSSLQLHDGSTRWLESRGVPVCDQSGTVVALRGTIQDITARHEIETRLRESEARFAAFMENIPAAAYMLDSEGRYLYVNRATAQEYSRANATAGRTVRECWPPEEAERIEAENNSVLDSGMTQCFDAVSGEGDNQRHWLKFKFPIHTEAAKPLIGAVCLEVTELMRNRETLRRTTALLEQAQRTALLGSWTYEAATGHIHWSREMYAMFGLPHDAPAPGFGAFLAMLAPEVAAEVRDPLFRAVHGEVIGPFVFRAGTRDGKPLWVEARCEPEFNEDGTLRQVIGTVQNVSQRVQMEQQLHESEVRFSAFMENIPVSTYMRDENGCFLYANRATRETFGITEEHIGRPPHAVWSQEIADRVLAEDALVLRENRPMQFVWHTGTQDEERHWITYKFPVPATENRTLVGAACVEITELTNKEAALKRSQAVLEQAQRTATLGWWTWHFETDTLEWSDEMFRLFGYQDRTQPPTFKELLTGLPTDSAKLVYDSLARASKGEPIPSTTYAAGTFEGRQRWLEGRCEPETDENGRVVRLLGTVQDVTERVESEQRLAEARHRYQAIFANTPDALFLFDENGTIEDVNISAQLQYGYTREEMLRRNVSELAAPSSRSRTPNLVAQTLQGPTAFESRHIDRNGREFAVDVHASAIVLEGRTMAIAIARDISARKAAEDQLRTSEARFRAISEASPLGMYVADVDGSCAYANQRMHQILECSPEEVLGTGWLQFAHGAERRKIIRHWQRAAMDTNAYYAAYQLTTGQGRTIHVSANVAPIVSQGILIGFVGCVEDITERLHLQHQLQEVRRMESIGRLAGGIAHDFNNLLTAIMGFAELAEDKLPPNSPAKADIQNVCKAADKAATLTRQLLGFARKQVQAPVAMCLNEDIENSVQIIERLLGSGIEMKLELSSSLWPVLADSVQMQQIYLNLAANARDAMPEGGTLHISTDNYLRTTGEDAQAEQFVRLRVQDTGIGMDEETLARIFDPFFTTKPLGKGTGLGLAMVYGIVQQNGGEIRCFSEPGAGACFEILLPRCTAAEPDQAEG
jgi:PAS domain S-box-containing protein